VFVDAPCTGSGTLRRHPENRWWWTPDAIARLQDLQRRLIADAARLVEPGGRLVYATCSVLRAEDEEVARALPGWTVERELRTWPHRDEVDGFYAAVLRPEVTGPPHSEEMR
jgi:16S rRNA (cytosine967-C5)-methyltransferase